MTEFLSEGVIAGHMEQLRVERLRYSILKKSISGLEKANIREISRQRMSRNDKKEALTLLGDILAHELFFDSFGKRRFVSSPSVDAAFGSAAALLNMIYREGIGCRIGFVGVSFNRGKIEVHSVSDGYMLYDYGEPMLVIDVSEHVYFTDYGFEKDRYLTSALPYLRLDKIDHFLKSVEKNKTL